IMPSRAVLRSVEDVKSRHRASGGNAIHRVKSGETLTTIAARYHVSVSDLQEWNGLGEGSALRAGQRLRVGQTTTRSRSRRTSVPPATQSSAHSSVHVLKRGETLTGVARKYGVGVAQLRQANNLPANAVLKAGTTLKIPG
ncbi:MAG: LysM peptidoglycan-binding domain-containing protein, partial [Gemmatimonadota bacterium]